MVLGMTVVELVVVEVGVMMVLVVKGQCYAAGGEVGMVVAVAVHV